MPTSETVGQLLGRPAPITVPQAVQTGHRSLGPRTAEELYINLGSSYRCQIHKNGSFCQFSDRSRNTIFLHILDSHLADEVWHAMKELARNNSSVQKTLQEMQILTTIPRLDCAADYAWRCPALGCSTWAMSYHSIRHHIRRNHVDRPEDAYQWTTVSKRSPEEVLQSILASG